jgi:hypothetical protein
MPENNPQGYRDAAKKRFMEAEARNRARKKDEKPDTLFGGGLLSAVKGFLKASSGIYGGRHASDQINKAVDK